jgi:hypothetical protein
MPKVSPAESSRLTLRTARTMRPALPSSAPEGRKSLLRFFNSNSLSAMVFWPPPLFVRHVCLIFIFFREVKVFNVTASRQWSRTALASRVDYFIICCLLPEQRARGQKILAQIF